MQIRGRLANELLAQVVERRTAVQTHGERPRPRNRTRIVERDVKIRRRELFLGLGGRHVELRPFGIAELLLRLDLPFDDVAQFNRGLFSM